MQVPQTLSPQGVAVMVEICAGSAVLSAEAQRRGFQVFPIDHLHNRFRAAAAILVVDLSSPDSRQLLPQLFEAVKPQWCHMGAEPASITVAGAIVWHLRFDTIRINQSSSSQ